jgi:hypothetical protein
MRRFSLRHNGAGDRPAADNPMHGRVPHLPARVIHVLISSETTKHRLPQQTYQRMAAGARIGESFDRHLGQAREFAVCQQSRIGREHGAAKLEYQAVVEIELENPVV